MAAMHSIWRNVAVQWWWKRLSDNRATTGRKTIHGSNGLQASYFMFEFCSVSFKANRKTLNFFNFQSSDWRFNAGECHPKSNGGSRCAHCCDNNVPSNSRVCNLERWSQFKLGIQQEWNVTETFTNVWKMILVWPADLFLTYICTNIFFLFFAWASCIIKNIKNTQSVFSFISKMCFSKEPKPMSWRGIHWEWFCHPCSCPYR